MLVGPDSAVRGGVAQGGTVPHTATPDTPIDVPVLPLAVRARAARAVAAAAHDAHDCALLLDMLGLSAADGQPEVPVQREPGDA